MLRHDIIVTILSGLSVICDLISDICDLLYLLLLLLCNVLQHALRGKKVSHVDILDRTCQPSWCCWTANVACRDWRQNKARDWGIKNSLAGELVVMFGQPGARLSLHDSG